jgi:hypothetical protein
MSAGCSSIARASARPIWSIEENERNDRGARDGSLKEGKLHFDRVFAPVARARDAKHRIQLEESLDELLVHRDRAEWSLVRNVEEGGEAERLVVARGHHDHGAPGSAGERAVRRGGRRAGEGVAGMRDDEPDDLSGGGRGMGLLDQSVDEARQIAGFARVELAGDGGIPNSVPGRTHGCRVAPPGTGGSRIPVDAHDPRPRLCDGAAGQVQRATGPGLAVNFALLHGLRSARRPPRAENGTTAADREAALRLALRRGRNPDDGRGGRQT